MTLKNKKTSKNKYLSPRSIGPVIVGIVMFILTRHQIVNAIANTENVDLALYLLDNDLVVNTEVSEKGFRQINYKYKDKFHRVTDDNRTNSDPKTDGEYITWMSQVDSFWQVFLYHVPTEEVVQLTSIGNNVNPSISGDYVVWEGQVAGVWQIFLYDGVKILQLTSGDTPSQHAGIENGYVVYDTKDSDSEDWNVYLYDIEKEETTKLSQYLPGKNPKILNGTITWTVIIDNERLEYKFFTDSMDTFQQTVNGETFDEDAYQEFISTLESTSAVDESTDESTMSEEGEEDGEGVTDVVAEEEITILEAPKLPETVTTEDIIKELTEVNESTESTQSRGASEN